MAMPMRYHPKSLSAILALACLFPVAAQAQPAPTPAALLEGIWEGTYVCRQGETHAIVTLGKSDASATARGTFTFGSLPGRSNARAGIFAIAATVQGASRDVKVVPTGWIERPENYVEIGFIVTLDANGQFLTGRVTEDGCSTITLQRRVLS